MPYLTRKRLGQSLPCLRLRRGRCPPHVRETLNRNHQGKNTVPRASLPWPKPTYRYFGGVLSASRAPVDIHCGPSYTVYEDTQWMSSRTLMYIRGVRGYPLWSLIHCV